MIVEKKVLDSNPDSGMDFSSGSDSTLNASPSMYPSFAKYVRNVPNKPKLTLEIYPMSAILAQYLTLI